MDSPLTTNGDALRLFFTDDVYLIPGEEVSADIEGLSALSAVPAAGAEVPAIAARIDAEPVSIPVTAASGASAEVPAVPGAAAAASENISFEFVGKNSRNILLLVNDEVHAVSDENGRELLRKIVKSVNLSANDFALVNYAKCASASFRQFQAFFSSSLIFAFGVTPSQLGLGQYPLHTIVKEGEVRIIFAAELKALDADPAGKKQLWGSLKQLEL